MFDSKGGSNHIVVSDLRLGGIMTLIVVVCHGIDYSIEGIVEWFEDSNVVYSG